MKFKWSIRSIRSLYFFIFNLWTMSTKNLTPQNCRYQNFSSGTTKPRQLICCHCKSFTYWCNNDCKLGTSIVACRLWKEVGCKFKDYSKEGIGCGGEVSKRIDGYICPFILSCQQWMHQNQSKQKSIFQSNSSMSSHSMYYIVEIVITLNCRIWAVLCSHSSRGPWTIKIYAPLPCEGVIAWAVQLGLYKQQSW